MDPVQQALENLKDIHSPESVSFWPPALGWWIVALFIVIALYFLFRYVRSYRFCLRRQAKRELASFWSHYLQAQDKQLLLQQLSELLRRCVAARKDTAHFSSLTGSAWLKHLDQGISTEDFSKGSGQVLATGPYQKEVQDYEPQHVYLLVNRWINKLPC